VGTKVGYCSDFDKIQGCADDRLSPFLWAQARGAGLRTRDAHASPDRAKDSGLYRASAAVEPAAFLAEHAAALIQG
jgi:broad specificity phosphatase PhoE